MSNRNYQNGKLSESLLRVSSPCLSETRCRCDMQFQDTPYALRTGRLITKSSDCDRFLNWLSYPSIQAPERDWSRPRNSCGCLKNDSRSRKLWDAKIHSRSDLVRVVEFVFVGLEYLHVHARIAVELLADFRETVARLYGVGSRSRRRRGARRSRCCRSRGLDVRDEVREARIDQLDLIPHAVL